MTLPQPLGNGAASTVEKNKVHVRQAARTDLDGIGKTRMLERTWLALLENHNALDGAEHTLETGRGRSVRAIGSG